MYCPEEDCTTVLYVSSVVELSPLVVGKPHTVQISKGKSYRGVTAGIAALRTIIMLCKHAHCLIITDIIHISTCNITTYVECSTYTSID